ncbi:MAG: cyclic nucleotide-binding domain-containing protein [Pleurocapsa sp. MO_226.B13]|nr:cyclic nucleotide-binding domain-containing protein [Pleurocapsa sp. MO_226.B13]
MNYSQNQILSALSKKEYQRLSKVLEAVELALGQILVKENQKSESLYFPTRGVVSLVSEMQDGSTTEVGSIGREGMVGTLEFLGNGVLNTRAVV